MLRPLFLPRIAMMIFSFGQAGEKAGSLPYRKPVFPFFLKVINTIFYNYLHFPSSFGKKY